MVINMHKYNSGLKTYHSQGMEKTNNKEKVVKEKQKKVSLKGNEGAL